MSTGRRHLLLLSEHDVAHPLAGEAERYLHEVARRWVAAGTRVTWAVTGTPGGPAREVVDGVEVVRSGGLLGLYPRAVLRQGSRFDAVVDATGVVTPIVPPVVGRRVPVVRVVQRVRHRAHTRSRGEALVGALARRVARWRRDDRATVVPSPSARHELRRGTGLRGPVFVAPPGADTVSEPGGRAADPVIVVVAPLEREQRVDLLLGRLPSVLARVPRLRVEIVGDGPEQPRLHRIAHDTGVARAVAFRGSLSDADRRAALSRAWLLVSAAEEVPGHTVLEAASHGVPCVALEAVGARDFVRVGEVVRTPDDLGPAVARHLVELADPGQAERVARRCRDWARRFGWDRTARLLAAALEDRVRATRRGAQRRRARSDIAALVRLPAGVRPAVGALRVTDEVDETDGVVSALLNGCDEYDALGVLERLGCGDAQVRLATHDDLLLGPRPAPEPLVPALTRKVDSHVRSR